MSKFEVKFGVCVRMVTDYEGIRLIAQETERLGFESGWLNDHMMMPSKGKHQDDFLEAWTLVSALSRDTTNLKWGHVVLCNAFRNPAVLAKMASALDVISGGRLILGMGLGWMEKEYLASGIPFPNPSVRSAQLREAVEIIKRLWTEDIVNYEGKYWQIKDGLNYPKPLQKPHPKILIGGIGEKFTLPIVAEHADIWNLTKLSVDECKQKIEVFEKYADKFGRDPDNIEKGMNGWVVIGKTEDEVNSRLKKLKEYGAPVKEPLTGTPEQIIDQLSQYIDIGITYHSVYFYWNDLSDIMESMQLFSEQVMPSFNG